PSRLTVSSSWPTSTMRPSNSLTSSTTWLRPAAAARTVATITSRSTHSRGRRPHPGQHQLPFDRFAGIQLRDLDDVDELEQLLGDLLQRRRLDVDDDHDAAEARGVG